MSLSPVLSLPFLEPSQAQKHVTHNEALETLDLLVQAVVGDRSRTSAPTDPEKGDRHIVAAGAMGDWAGKDHFLALWTGERWAYAEPSVGWRAYVLSDRAVAVFTGSGWELPADQELRATRLGIGATPDAVNRLAVSSDATLLGHAGFGHQLKINKANAQDTASLLFQNNHSGRAEMGVVGNDDFSIKVSADGSSFRTALSVDRSTGHATLHQGLTVTGTIDGTAVQSHAVDVATGKLLRVGAFGLGGLAPVIGDAATTANTIAPGIYHIDTSKGSVGGPDGVSFGMLIHVRRASGGGETQMVIVEGPEHLAGQIHTRARGSRAWSKWRTMWDKSSTTVDSNGFIKQASPIVRLFDDRIEEPVQPTGAVMARNGTGQYHLSETLGLAQTGWQIETPRDHNGNPLVHIVTRWADGMLHIETSEPVWLDGRFVAGAPLDIPQGRWVDLRLHEAPPEKML